MDQLHLTLFMVHQSVENFYQTYLTNKKALFYAIFILFKPGTEELCEVIGLSASERQIQNSS